VATEARLESGSDVVRCSECGEPLDSNIDAWITRPQTVATYATAYPWCPNEDCPSNSRSGADLPESGVRLRGLPDQNCRDDD
jgi:hypothetical protein